MSGNGNIVFRSHFKVFFPAIVIAALIVTIYHCIIVICRNSRQRSPPQAAATGKGSNIERFMVETHKYEKGKGFHDGECPVCLSEFEEGEEIRTLPECKHSYHVECIDMWLYSHPNCPMCRTNATPLPLPQVHGPSPMDARLNLNV